MRVLSIVFLTGCIAMGIGAGVLEHRNYTTADVFTPYFNDYHTYTITSARGVIAFARRTNSRPPYEFHVIHPWLWMWKQKDPDGVLKEYAGDEAFKATAFFSTFRAPDGKSVTEKIQDLIIPCWWIIAAAAMVPAFVFLAVTLFRTKAKAANGFPIETIPKC